MIYVLLDDAGEVCSLTFDAKEAHQHGAYETRNDWATFAQAQARADELNAMDCSDVEFIATDAGEWVSSRYDVIVLPAVGDDVSYGFNGDCYPCGQIASISASKRVVRTNTGKTFYRRRQTGSWVMSGTWSLVRGHHRSLNPEF